MSDERFDDFVARAAHELASPLNKVVAFSGILREELDASDLNDEARDTLLHLSRAAEEARAVVQGFHEWARATRIAPVRTTTLSSCLEGALNSLGERIRGGGVERADAFAVGAVETVRADADALRRVLELLLENSAAYVAPNTGPRIRVAAHPVAAHPVAAYRAESSWRLLVDDAGLGVETDERERVFEPFVRLHGKSRYPGAGLGLSIARRLIEAHGGRLVLEDSPWGGVRACIELPARGAVTPPDPREA